MGSYIVRRLLLVPLVLWGTATLLFFLSYGGPGDTARKIAGPTYQNRPLPPQLREQIEEKYGLDEPLVQRYFAYMGKLVTGDLGVSNESGDDVSDIAGRTFAASFRLAFWALLIEVAVGIGAGMLSAVRTTRRWPTSVPVRTGDRGTADDPDDPDHPDAFFDVDDVDVDDEPEKTPWWAWRPKPRVTKGAYTFADGAITLLTIAAGAVPVFVMGYLLIEVFAIWPAQQGWPHLPTNGIGPDTWVLGVIPTGDQWRYLILPAITLAMVETAIVARVTRSSLIEASKMDYIRTARAKGIAERRVTVKHGLRTALIPVVTLIGIDAGVLLGSAVLTETVFNWPGMGSEIATAVQNQDVPVIVGLSMIVVVAYVVINLGVDLSYAWLDPRVRLGKDTP